MTQIPPDAPRTVEDIGEEIGQVHLGHMVPDATQAIVRRVRAIVDARLRVLVGLAWQVEHIAEFGSRAEVVAALEAVAGELGREGMRLRRQVLKTIKDLERKP